MHRDIGYNLFEHLISKFALHPTHHYIFIPVFLLKQWAYLDRENDAKCNIRGGSPPEATAVRYSLEYRIESRSQSKRRGHSETTVRHTEVY